jgi:hypothetical protein
MVLVRERTIPTERPPLVDEVNANFLPIDGCRVVRAAYPYSRNLGFLDRKFKVISKLKLSCAACVF